MTVEEKIEYIREFFDHVDAVDLNSEFYQTIRNFITSCSIAQLEEIKAEKIRILSELAKNRIDFLRSYH